MDWPSGALACNIATQPLRRSTDRGGGGGVTAAGGRVKLLKAWDGGWGRRSCLAMIGTWLARREAYLQYILAPRDKLKLQLNNTSTSWVSISATDQRLAVVGLRL